MITTSSFPTSTAGSGSEGSGGFGVFGVQVVVDSAASREGRSGGDLKGWIWGVGVVVGVGFMI